MVKSNNDPKVTISAAMLNCLKQLIFSQTGGVDLSPIVEDLGGGDQTAIAVALAYKGIKPEIDTATRFDYNCTFYNKYEFVSYSVILDAVTVTKTYISYNKETKQWDTDNRQYKNLTFSLDRWLDASTSEEDCRTRVKEFIESRK